MRSRMLLILVALLLIGAAPAQASSVSGVTVQNDLPSSAAGARTQYVVGFTAATALSQTAGDKITVAFPAGTDFSALASTAVIDVTANQQVGGACRRRAGRSIVCSAGASRSRRVIRCG